MGTTTKLKEKLNSNLNQDLLWNAQFELSMDITSVGVRKESNKMESQNFRSLKCGSGVDALVDLDEKKKSHSSVEKNVCQGLWLLVVHPKFRYLFQSIRTYWPFMLARRRACVRACVRVFALCHNLFCVCVLIIVQS